MAEISTEELDSTIDEPLENTIEAEPESFEHSTTREIGGPLESSSEHSPESQQLQAELGSDVEKYGNPDRLESSALPIRGSKDEKHRHNDAKFSVSSKSDVVNQEQAGKRNDPLQQALEHARTVLGEEMRWKESLRLRHIHGSCHPSYFDSWMKEANLFFRRVVIINRRLENNRNKKRA